MPSVLGLDAKLYRNTGTWSSPTWNEVPNVRDLSMSLTKGEADVSNRGSKWKLVRGAMRDASIEFEMVWDNSDADFEAFRDAWLNDSNIEVLVLDGPQTTAGSEGLRAVCQVIDFTRDEPLEGALMVKVVIKPTYDTNMPVWYTAS